MRTRLALLPLLVLPAAAACGGGGGGGGGDYNETGRLEITMIVPPDDVPAQDPFAGAETLRITVLGSGGSVLLSEDFGVNDALEIRELEPGGGRVVVLEALDDTDAVISRGRTLPVDVVEGPTVETSLYFSRVNEFATVYGTPAPRTGASAWAFSDGRVLIAGGLDGTGAAVTSAEVFDPETDSVLPAGDMAAPHAFAAIAPLGGDTVLVTGGVTDAAGAVSAEADVYVHTPGGVGTWAAGVPAMSDARREHGAVELGTGRVFVAGGASSSAADGPPLRSTELFEWDGAAGVWTGGPDMDDPRMGGMALAADGDVAVFAGGFNDNQGGGGGPNDFSREYDVFTWNGADVDADVGNNGLTIRRGWASVLPLGGDEWLVFGGEVQAGGGAHSVVADVEQFTLTGGGNNLTTAALADLPAAQRDGAAGLVPGGRALLLGGNTAVYAGQTPAPTALVYDVTGDAFTPLPAGPGPTLGGAVLPLPDGTLLTVIDGAVLRFTPE